MGRSSPLKYSQSIHDLSHIPERDKWNSPGRKQGNAMHDCNNLCLTNIPNTQQSTNNFQDSNSSITVDIQLCNCYMKDFVRNTTPLSNVYSSSSAACSLLSQGTSFNCPVSPEKTTPEYIRPRKLQLDKTLTKYKLHKSLPVSPVSEERRFSDYVQESAKTDSSRKSFSYFVDFSDRNSTEEDLKRVCSDIEEFSANSNRQYKQIEKKFTPEDKNHEDEGSFSSDSLEDNSFLSVGVRKSKKSFTARRCVSNNEIYKYQEEQDVVQEIPRSESFYLNQNIRNSRDSVLSDDLLDMYDDNAPRCRSYCNSMESVLSNESECKSAPLEVLFSSQRKTQYSELTNNYYESCTMSSSPSHEFYTQGSSLPKNYESSFANYVMRQSQSMHENAQFSTAKCMKTSQTQTDLNFESPEEIVAKKKTTSVDFQRKLLKFEACIAQNVVKKPEKSIAFFINADKKSKQKKSKPDTENVENEINVNNTKNVAKTSPTMYIPSLESKNKQYKSKYCNVLNNKPECNIEIFESGHSRNGSTSFTLTNFNFEKNTNCNQDIQTSSLDRHLFTKSLLNSEKVCHKPPKAIRRHSSKTRKTKTSYEYVKKDEFYKKSNKVQNSKREVLNNQNLNVTNANTIEFSYKEKNIEKDLEMSNKGILNELYDSLDKQILNTRMENDSLEVNINNAPLDFNIYDSLEVDSKNLYTKNFEKQFCSANSSEEIDQIQFALENIKILNEIQQKVARINDLVDIFKKNMCSGKVRALSSMYESMTSSKSCYNDLGKIQMPHVKFRRRNLSLPNFMERRLNFEGKIETEDEKAKKIWRKPAGVMKKEDNEGD